MKHKLFKMIAVFCLAMMVSIPVEAADYGVIYDETEVLYSEELNILGTETLPQFTEAYGFDVRVDILLGISDYENLEDAAKGIYENYEYGYGEGRNGVSLTILLQEFEDGYVLDNWYLYFAGDHPEWTAKGTSDLTSFANYFTEDAWVGGLQQDAETLAKGVQALISDLEPIASVMEVEKDSSYNEWMKSDAQLNHVTDAVGLLTEEEQQMLETQAIVLEETYGFGVYLMVVNDYREYTDGSVQDAAVAIYKEYSLGTGKEKDGIMLLLSMNDRDYSLITRGTTGNYTFNDEGRAYLTEYFLDDFSEDDWYTGFEDYITWCGSYLEEARLGEPYSDDNVPMSASERASAIRGRVLVILLVPLVIAAIYIGILSAKLKNVEQATDASNYMAGNLQLKKKIDRFTHRTETRRKISDDSDDSSGGGGKSSGSSGFSGSSGKF